MGGLQGLLAVAGHRYPHVRSHLVAVSRLWQHPQLWWRGALAAVWPLEAEATPVAEVTLVSDAAATLAATQSAANGGPVGDDESAAIAMQ